MYALRTGVALFLTWALTLAGAYGQNPPTDPVKLQINARAAVLMEVSTQTLMFEQNPDQLIEPASFTKILTLYLVFEGLEQGLIHLQDPVWISERAWRTGGSRMFVEVNSQVPLEELIKGIAVVSGNDACVAVAEHMYGSVEAFVAAMNKKAKELGMNHSSFHNPNGLPVDGQVTTARDMARLATAYINRFPQALRFHSMQQYTYNNIKQRNRNHLLAKDKTVDGLKTGYVAKAGYHLAATSTRGPMRLLAVVMGADKPRTREAEAAKLLNWGYRHFALLEPLPASKPLATVSIWKGVDDHCELYPEHPIRVVIPASQKNSLRVEIDAAKDATAPIEPGQQLGSAKIFVGANLLSTVPLAATSAIAQAGLLKRLWHSLMRVHSFDFGWKRVALGALAIFTIFLMAFGFFSRKRKRRSRRRI